MKPARSKRRGPRNGASSRITRQSKPSPSKSSSLHVLKDALVLEALKKAEDEWSDVLDFVALAVPFLDLLESSVSDRADLKPSAGVAIVQILDALCDRIASARPDSLDELKSSADGVLTMRAEEREEPISLPTDKAERNALFRTFLDNAIVSFLGDGTTPSNSQVAEHVLYLAEQHLGTTTDALSTAQRQTRVLRELDRSDGELLPPFDRDELIRYKCGRAFRSLGIAPTPVDALKQRKSRATKEMKEMVASLLSPKSERSPETLITIAERAAAFLIGECAGCLKISDREELAKALLERIRALKNAPASSLARVIMTLAWTQDRYALPSDYRARASREV